VKAVEVLERPSVSRVAAMALNAALNPKRDSFRQKKATTVLEMLEEQDTKRLGNLLRQASTLMEIDFLAEEVEVEQEGKWKGVLYGFRPTFVAVLSMFVVTVTFNIRWVWDDSMGFYKLDPRRAVEGSDLLPGAGGLLLTRFVSFLLSFGACAKAVIRYRHANEEEKVIPLFLGGFEVLLVFCTLWTWVWKCLYFAWVTSLSIMYYYVGIVPAWVIASPTWVAFDIAFGVSWLVFWAVWVFLIPAAWLAGKQEALRELLSPFQLYLHNVNVVLVTTEALLNQFPLIPYHFIFPLYFGFAYVGWNWWLYEKIHVWIYFFLDYNRPASVPICAILLLMIAGSFLSGASMSHLLGK